MGSIHDGDADDPAFGPAFLDVDERRDVPVPHHYLHGGFDGTETRFSIYLPEPSAYEGRLIQELPGGHGGAEPQGPEYVQFFVAQAFRLGAVVVCTNQGWMQSPARPGEAGPGLPQDLTILSHRASAQAARFAKAIAEERLGSRPHHSYLFGGSGGGARSVACMERVPGMWDGAVPLVMANQHLSWHLWSVWSLAAPVLRDKKVAIMDAVDAGGSGDPFAVLDTDEQRRALADLYFAGFPRGGEWHLDQAPADWANWILNTDPGYVEDFWTLPGYAGSDMERVRVTATVVSLVSASDPEGPALISSLPKMVLDRGMVPADVVVGARVSGVEVSSRLVGCRFGIGDRGEEVHRLVTAVAGDCIGFATLSALQPGAPTPRPGDEIVLDDAVERSWPYYHRHVIDPQRPTMRRWACDGRPLWPQRRSPARATLGSLPTGRFAGKMIVVQTSLDQLCPLAFAHDYVQLVRDQLRDADDHVRLWILENGMHGEPVPGGDDALNLRFIRWFTAALQALADLVAWVEDGVAPPATTSYEVDAWNQIRLTPEAVTRAGIQPVISVEAPANARPGEKVRLSAVVEVPPGAGSIVAAAWDVDGSGRFDQKVPVDVPADRLVLELEHTFADAGTHFVHLSVASHRDGDAADRSRFVRNLDRARICVQ